MKKKDLRRAATVSTFALMTFAPFWANAQTPAAQPANPTPGCTATPEQLAANKKVAMQFFAARGAARVALAAPTYRQHNPVFKKRAEANHETDYEEYKKFFSTVRGPQPVLGPRPPQGNPFEIVTAECDIVTIVHKVYRQDPTAAPGVFYAAFTFDTFRVTNGKLTEHWDGALITPATGR